MTLKIRLDYLNSFTKVVEKGSLLAASKNLGMSVSTISVQMTCVEEFFDTKLLERSVKGVELTKEGKLVYKNVKEILENIRETKRLLESLRTKDIYVASGCIGVPIISQIQMLYKAKNPRVNVQFELRGAYECMKLLDEGKVNMILIGYLPSNLSKEKYVIEEIGKDKLVLLVPPDHELAKKDKIYAKDVLSHPMVTLSDSYGVTSRIEEALAKVGHSSEDMIIGGLVDDIFTQICGVSGGLGTAITYYIPTVRYGDGGFVKIKDIEDFTDKRPIYIIYHKTALQNPNIKEFIEFAVEQGKALVKEYNV